MKLNTIIFALPFLILGANLNAEESIDLDTDNACYKAWNNADVSKKEDSEFLDRIKKCYGRIGQPAQFEKLKSVKSALGQLEIKNFKTDEIEAELFGKKAAAFESRKNDTILDDGKISDDLEPITTPDSLCHYLGYQKSNDVKYSYYKMSSAVGKSETYKIEDKLNLVEQMNIFSDDKTKKYEVNLDDYDPQYKKRFLYVISDITCAFKIGKNIDEDLVKSLGELSIQVSNTGRFVEDISENDRKLTEKRRKKNSLRRHEESLDEEIDFLNRGLNFQR